MIPFSNVVDPKSMDLYTGGFLGGMMGALIGISILIMLILVAAIYVYFALAWKTIATKLRHPKPWLAWIPIANFAMMLQLGRFDWKWVFLVLVPVLGWIALMVLLIISTWRIFEKRNYPGWLSLLCLIPQAGPLIYMILIGFVAWSNRR